MTSGTRDYRRRKDQARPVSKKNALASTEAGSPAFRGWLPPDSLPTGLAPLLIS